MPQCTAKSKRSGQQCRRHASLGRHVCRMHGAASLRGTEHPNWRHGLTAKHWPEELLELAMAAAANDDLLDPRNEAALVEALKLLRLARLKSSGQDATAADESALLALVGAKLQAIDRHDRARRINRRFSEIQLLRFASVLREVLKRHVHDPSVQTAISNDINAEQQMIGIILRGDDVE